MTILGITIHTADTYINSVYNVAIMSSASKTTLVDNIVNKPLN